MKDGIHVIAIKVLIGVIVIVTTQQDSLLEKKGNNNYPARFYAWRKEQKYTVKDDKSTTFSDTSLLGINAGANWITPNWSK